MKNPISVAGTSYPYAVTGLTARASGALVASEYVAVASLGTFGT